MSLQTIAHIRDGGSREAALKEWCAVNLTNNPTKMLRVALDVNIWDARKLEVLIFVLEYAGCSKWDVQKTVLDVATAEIKRITDRLEAAQSKKVKHGR